MAISTIDRVREAELKANERQEAAELEAQRIESDADERAEALLADARRKAADFDQKALEEAKKRAGEMVQSRRAAALQEAQALSEKTLKLKQSVINKLIQETLM